MAIAAENYSILQAKLLKDKALWCDPDFPADDKALGNLPDLAGKVVWKRIKHRLNGCYSNLNGGLQSEAMEDCTGGLAETISLREGQRPDDLLHVMQLSFQRSVLMGCSAAVNCKNKLQHLVRCRNPWGDANEWRGPWSDGSKEWAEVSKAEQAELQVKFNNDGEFCHWRKYVGLWYKTLTEIFRLNTACVRCRLKRHELTAMVNSGTLPKINFLLQVNCKNKLQHLVRCRNPWGDANEWRGPWSDGSKEWAEVSKAEQAELQVKFNNDGEFWMPLEEFVKCFTDLEICHLGLESLESNEEVRGKRRLQEAVHRGEWKRNLSAGGLTFPTNPQYVVDVTDPDPDDNKKFCNVIVGLMQKDVRRLKGADFYAIGFSVYANDEQWLKQRFEQLSKDSNGAMNAIKLRQLLNESTLKNVPNFEPLSLEVCRTIVSAMDQAFLKSDENRSGQLSSAELRDALASAGFQISNLVFLPIVQRYTQPDTGNASFEDFIHCCVRLKAAFELFKAQPKNFCEEATFNLEDYLRLTTYV
ncbi:hypothetical protein AHF37_01368 [Paragonimus kellicotti]|nr:hypothetical protein AHF37_01368 [Paragonimus kellicotti]